MRLLLFCYAVAILCVFADGAQTNIAKDKPHKPPQGNISPPSEPLVTPSLANKNKENSPQRVQLLQKWADNKAQKDADDIALKLELEQLAKFDLQTETKNGDLEIHSYYTKSQQYLDQGKYDDYISLLRQAAEGDHKTALYELGRLYEFGNFLDRDISKAVRYYKKSAELGHAEGQRAYAFMLDQGRVAPQNTGKAILYYTFAADNRDVEASLVLGNKFLRGYDTPKSCSSALKYYKFAASRVIEENKKKPFINAQHFHLVSLPNKANAQDGDGMSREEILDYIKFNANSDNPHLLVEIGMLYLFGHYGHEIDYAIAKDYFEQVLNNNDEPKAAAMLGRMYEFGLGVPVSAVQAKTYYTIAVEKKNVQGLVFLGEMYVNGRGIGVDYTKAYDLFVQAAQMQAPEAHVNLGIMYFEGLGVKQDFEKALSYFKNVIGKGFSVTTCTAEYYFAEMLHYGIGSAVDCNGAVAKYKSVTEKGEWIHNMEKASSAYEEDNIETALIIYEKLAEIGIGLAQVNSAWIYDKHFLQNGLTTSPFGNSLAQAVKFYSRAADQGNEYAHLRLGDCYYYGEGHLEVDFAKAASHYRYIGNVHPQAHFNLAYMHQYGEGVKKDLYLSKRYYDSTLEMQPDAFLPVYLCLANIGIEYASQLYSEGKTEQLISDAVEYFTPAAYKNFYNQILEDYYAEEPAASEQTMISEKMKAKEQTVGFLDRESIFGYNWDTVLIISIGTTLCVTLLFRFGIIQIQIV
mmetsp:Transcript_115027/g.171927  ORF Transcript_115027/g.171927 Transcript_115027/m.171927 type:complete len:745 (+) Transcript_115027:30-2264(+)